MKYNYLDSNGEQIHIKYMNYDPNVVFVSISDNNNYLYLYIEKDQIIDTDDKIKLIFHKYELDINLLRAKWKKMFKLQAFS